MSTCLLRSGCLVTRSVVPSDVYGGASGCSTVKKKCTVIMRNLEPDLCTMNLCNEVLYDHGCH